jgi:hypothetical protein
VKSESKYVLITFYLSGSYKSCGNSYTITEAKTIELEPLMSKNYRLVSGVTVRTILLKIALILITYVIIVERKAT